MKVKFLCCYVGALLGPVSGSQHQDKFYNGLVFFNQKEIKA